MTHAPWAHVAPLVAGLASSHPGIFIPLIILAMILIAAAGWHASAQRRKELLAWATARGLVFCSGRTDRLEREYPDFSCLQQGHSRYGYNLLQGRWGDRAMLGFDYRYVTGSGKNRQVHQFSAVILDSPVQLQPLLIRPEHLFDKMSAFFGFDDINFESAEFSRRFFVKAANKRWAYDVIHPRAMEFLMAQPPFSIQFDFGRVICYRDRRFAPADFETACRVVTGLLDLLPEYVVRQQGAIGKGQA
jgi:hypothetical protein